jgi:hypothetical protein
MTTEEPKNICYECDCDCGEDYSVGTNEHTYCYDCWNDLFGYCHACDEMYRLDDLYSCDDGLVCADCQDDDNVSYNPVYAKPGADYDKLGSPRCFGVEIETDHCSGHVSALRNSVWGAKNDCSVNGKEFFSSILSGNSGLDAIDKIANVARRNGWGVDDNCGLHVHFDMRDESTDGLKAIGLAYLLTNDVWFQFVEEDRRDNHYCGPNNTDISELFGVTNFRYWAGSQSRYCWINFASYYNHTTFEVRSHQGTLNGREISNWVRAHAIFMDWASRMGWAKVRNLLLTADTAGRMDIIAGVWAAAGADDLVRYYKDKAEQYQTVDSCCDNW